MLPYRNADTDDIDAPDCRLRGASPQYEASLSWSGKSAMSMDMTRSEAVRGPMPGTVSKHLYASSGASSADLGGQRLDLGGVLGNPPREQLDRPVLA